MTSECYHCAEEVGPNAVESDEHVFCDRDCRDSYAEAAYERSLSDYYGGSGPVTLDEQLAEARKLK